MTDLAMKKPGDVVISADVGQEQDLALSNCLFDRLASWRLTPSDPLAPGLILAALDADTIELEWKTTIERGAQHPQPTSIKLLVPTELVNEQSGWHFKAALVSNFLSSGAHQSAEPLATPFFKSLMQRGFKVTRIEHAVLSDAVIDLHLAPEAVVANARLNGSLELKCQRLDLTNVEIKDCKINFNVNEGSWRRVVVKGERTHLLGELGSTTLDENCSFDGPFVNVNLKKATLLGDDLHKRFKRFQGGSWAIFSPEQCKRLHLSNAQPGETERRQAIISAARWSDVKSLDWSEVSDRVGNDKQGATSRACRIDDSNS